MTKKISGTILHIINALTSRLIYEFLAILAFMLLILSLTFTAAGFTLKNVLTEQSRNYSQVTFSQAIDQITGFVSDIDDLHINIVNNSIITNYLETDSWANRWDVIPDFQQIAYNNQRINRHLANISLYDLNNNLVAAQGKVFFPLSISPEDKGHAAYSSCLQDAATTNNYFQAVFSIYKMKPSDHYNRIGNVCLLFDTEYLQSILENAQLSPDCTLVLLDREDNRLASVGPFSEECLQHTKSTEDKDHLIYVASIASTGWRLINIVPKTELLSVSNQLQPILFLMTGALLIAVILIMLLIYYRIIRPIAAQTAFMAGFTQDPGQRIQVKGHDEISELASRMNKMLDDIEVLNDQILEDQKQFLELDYAKKQTEMIAYRSQINPHFLYNTFNCIRGMALFHGEKDIADLTLHLSSFFRYSVHGGELTTLAEGLENMQHYAKIIDYRFNGKHRVLIHADDACGSFLVPKMLIQPLVENAVLHGLEPRIRGDVSVEIFLANDRLHILVADEGEGIDSNTLSQLRESMHTYDRDGSIPDIVTGIGVLNVYRRMRLFYGEEADMDIETAEGEGTRILLQLPLRTEP